MKERLTVKTAIILIVTVLIVSYGYSRVRNLARGPEINIASPENGATLTQSLVEIKGSAERISLLSLNDRKIFTDEKGNWSESLLLGEGYNILAVRAEDKFGRGIYQTLELIYQPNN